MVNSIILSSEPMFTNFTSSSLLIHKFLAVSAISLVLLLPRDGSKEEINLKLIHLKAILTITYYL